MITTDSLFATFAAPEIMFPLIGSLVAGAMIGAERELQGKSAGLRTHTLVCFTSALMTLVALRQGHWGADLTPNTQIVSDLSRMPHAILTGIGFLCAGVIFRHGASVHGLTTAAALWVSAALGIAYGAAELELAVIGTLITLLVLISTRLAQRLAPTAGGQLKIRILTLPVPDTADQSAGFDSPALVKLLAELGLTAGPIALSWDRSRQSSAFTTVVEQGVTDDSLTELSKLLRSHPAVQEFTLEPIAVVLDTA